MLFILTIVLGGLGAEKEEVLKCNNACCLKRELGVVIMRIDGRLCKNEKAAV
jgi:hypothetical protein